MGIPDFKHIVKRVIGAIKWLFISIVILLVTIYFLLQLSSVQNFIKDKIVAYVTNKIHTPFRIKSLRIKFFKTIQLQGVYLEGQHKDTILSAKNLEFNLSMLQLIKSSAEIKEIRLEGVTTDIERRYPDGTFNFQYIINAFASGDTTTTNPVDTTSSPFKMNLEKLVLSDIRVHYHDDVTGNNVAGNVGYLETAMRDFDTKTMNIDIPRFVLERTSLVVKQYTPLVKLVGDTAISDAHDTSSLNIPIRIGSIDLRYIGIGYKDDPGAMLFTSMIGNVHILPKSFDLANLALGFDKIEVAQVQALVNMGKSSKPASKDTSSSKWHFTVADLGIDKVGFTYNDLTARPIARGMDYGHIQFKDIHFDGSGFDLTPTQYKGSVDSASLSEKGGLVLNSLRTNFVYSDSGAVLGKLYLKTPKTILRDSLYVHYPSLDAITKDPGKMYLFANLKKSSIAASDILAVAPMMESYMQGYENAVFKLNTTVKGYVRDLSIPELELSGLQNTYVKMRGSLKGLPDVNKFSFNFIIDALKTTLGDIKKIVPANMVPQLAEMGDGPLMLRGALNGDMKNINIGNLELKGLSNTYVQLKGKMLNYSNPNKAYFDITIPKLQTGRTDILALVPKSYMPKNKFRIPNNLILKGFFKGGLSAFRTNMSLNTSNGMADVLANLNRDGKYTATFNTKDLDLGYLLMMDTIVGKTTLSTTATGDHLDLNRFDLNKLTSQFAANIDYLDLYKYRYQNFVATGLLEKGIVDANANISDQNIQFAMHAVSDLKPKYPTIQLEAQLDTLNPYALHLTTSPMALKAHFSANFSSTNPDSLVGQMAIKNFIFRNDSLNLYYDSLYVNATKRDSLGTILAGLDSTFQLKLDGQFKLTEMATAIQNNLYNYYHIPGYKRQKVAPQNWTLDGFILPNSDLIKVVPELKSTDSIVISGALKTQDSSFAFGARSRNLAYGDYQFRNFNVMTRQESDSVLRLLGFVTEMKSPSFNLFGTGIDARLEKNVLRFDAGTTDSLWNPLYGLIGKMVIDTAGKYYSLHLDPAGVILNYDTWNVPDSNILVYDAKKGIYAKDFVISKNGESLSLQSVSDTANAPLDVAFHNFRLTTLTHIANTSQYPIKGTINGNAELRNLLTTPVFVSDIKVDTISYGDQPIGNLTLKVNNNAAPDVYNADIRFDGNNNDVALTGNFFTATKSLDMNLALNKLNLGIVKPFSMGQLSEIGGSMNGNIAITGPTDSIRLNGYTAFDSAYLRPTLTNARLRLPNDKILIDNAGFHFNKFRILDSSNNKFTLNGDLLTTNYMDYAFNLNMKARDFMPINTPKSSNRFFFGKLAFDTDMHLGGDMNSPSVTGTIHVDKETNFSLLMPTDDPEAMEREGVVVFTDKKHPVDTLKLFTLLDSMSTKSELKGMNVDLNIQTDTSAVFSMVLDERTDDALVVSGNADLAFGIDKSGKMSLTGDYALTKGSYQLSLDILKKKFDIQRGSKITWTGDPLSAIVDITAVYNQKAAPIDLIQQQLGSTTNTTIYKQQLPFAVEILLKNNLMQPQIGFDIVLPDEYTSQYSLVDTKLKQLRNDPSETNKQVFALLLLGRFIGENPLQSAGPSSTAGDMALQTGTRLLSDQLNKIAGNLVHGVDLNFDLSSGTDYSTGTQLNRTDLAVGMSKSLLNDRIQVSIGSSFALGDVGANQQAANIAGDVSIGYKLSEDGRYLLRAYRKNQYEGVIEGQVVKTGLGFAFTLDYDKFKELLMTPAAREKAARQRKKENARRIREKENKEYGLQQDNDTDN